MTLIRDTLKTKSGAPLTLGAGSGTKWHVIKRARDQTEAGTLVEPLVASLVGALEAGVNHVDTAEVYDTYAEVSEALKRTGYLADAKARERVFITDKHYAGGFGTFPPFSESPMASLETALASLQTSYIDLYLLHLPFFNPEGDNHLTLKEIWQQLEQAVRDGKVRYIGVSNCAVPHLQEILAFATIKPVVNQIEYHAYLQEQTPGIVTFCKQNGIVIETYGPLSPLFRGNDAGKLDGLLDKIGQSHGKNRAQVLLRWVWQQGHLPITTSSNPQRFKEALTITTFSLTPEEVSAISKEGAQYHFRALLHDEFARYYA